MQLIFLEVAPSTEINSNLWKLTQNLILNIIIILLKVDYFSNNFKLSQKDEKGANTTIFRVFFNSNLFIQNALI